MDALEGIITQNDSLICARNFSAIGVKVWYLFQIRYSFVSCLGVRGAEYKITFFGAVNEVLKGKKYSETFFGKHRSIISKAKRSFQVEFGELIACPLWNFNIPALFRAEEWLADKVGCLYALFLCKRVAL